MLWTCSLLPLFATCILTPRNSSVSPPSPPPDQFHHILYEGPIKSVSLHTIWGPLRSVSSHTIYEGPIRSVSSHTIWGPLQICFFSYYLGAPSNHFFLRILYGDPLKSVFLAYYMGPPEISFFTYYMGPTRFCILCWGPPQINFIAHYMGLPHMIISLSSDTIWGLPQICFFAYYMFLAYYMGTPSDQFLCIL